MSLFISTNNMTVSTYLHYELKVNYMYVPIKNCFIPVF